MKIIKAFFIILLFQYSLYAGYIKSWYLCGPFLNETLSAECFKHEGKVVPGEGLKSGNKSWVKYYAADNVINFDSGEVFGPQDNCNGFAGVIITSPQDHDAVLLLGSDDGVRVWLNQNMVLNNDIPRGFTLDEDKVNIKLNKGRNVLVFKVNDLGGGWNLAARIVDHEYQEIKGLQYDPISKETGLLQIKKIEASSEQQGEANIMAANAVDGLSDTRWSSEASDPQWLVLDLGETFTFRQLEILWETAYASQYEIQVSKDKNKWQTVFTEENSDGGNDICKLSNARGRYLRIYCIKRGTNWGYSIWELKLSGYK